MHIRCEGRLLGGSGSSMNAVNIYETPTVCPAPQASQDGKINKAFSSF